MLHKLAGLTIALALVVTGASCHEGEGERQTVRQAREAQSISLNTAHAAMVDNARLRDMSIADVHFVPHTTELSNTGAECLERMAPYLNTYGGTIRYQTYATDENLVAARMEHVREFLTTTRCDMERVEIKAMMAGGRMINAAKAIEIVQRNSGASTSGSVAAGGGAGGAAGSAQFTGAGG